MKYVGPPLFGAAPDLAQLNHWLALRLSQRNSPVPRMSNTHWPMVLQ